MPIELAESQEALPSLEAASSGIQVVSFRLAEERYGVNIMDVQEVVLLDQITEMPQVPGHVRGLINLRGDVIPVLDLRVRLSLAEPLTTDASRIVVVNVREQTVGIIVDAVEEVLRIGEAQIEQAPQGLCGAGEEYVSGIVKLDAQLLILLNIEALVMQETATLGAMEPVAVP